MQARLILAAGGKWLLQTSPQGIQLWDLELQLYMAQVDELFVGIADDGRSFLTRRADATFGAWWINPLQPIEPKTLSSQQYAPDQRYYSLREGRVQLALYDALGRKAPRYLDLTEQEDPKTICDGRAVSPDGTQIALSFTADFGGQEVAWGGMYTVEGERRYKFAVSRYAVPPLLHFAPTQPLLAVSSYPDCILLYDVNDGTARHDLKHTPSGGKALAIAPTEALTVAYTMAAQVWQLWQADKTLQFEETAVIEALGFHPDGAQVVCLLADGSLRLYDWRSQTLLATMTP
jgi:WD40 repeat protein